MDNLLIVGSGPSGYTAAIYAARAGLAPVVLAGSITAGGALMNTTEVENFPGFPDGIMGPDLMANLQSQAEKFGAKIIWDDGVSFELAGPVKTVTTATGDTISARSVILALGSEYRKLGVPGEAELAGRGVSYCATCDGFFFKDQNIVVVGGGDSAMEEATFLSRFAAKVTVIHRRNELRASKILVDRAKANPKIHFLWDTVVTKVNGANSVTSLTVENLLTGEKTDFPATGIFVAIGQDPRTELLGHQVALDPDGYILVAGRSSRTDVPGVFASGDVIDRTYQQAITAAASGCVAALDAQDYLATLPQDAQK